MKPFTTFIEVAQNNPLVHQFMHKINQSKKTGDYGIPVEKWEQLVVDLANQLQFQQDRLATLEMFAPARYRIYPGTVTKKEASQI